MNFKQIVLATGVAAMFAAPMAANALFSTTVGDFKNNQVVQSAGGVDFTFAYTDGTGLDPVAPNATATTLPDATELSFNAVIFNGVATANVAIGADALSTIDSTGYTFSYTIELFAAAPSSNPDLRFDEIKHGVDLSTGTSDSHKYVVGQDTVLVDPATFTADLHSVNGADVGPVSCGICRKFAVTDTFKGTPSALINSVSNSYNVVVPVPGILSLFGLGLAGLGLSVRRRKA